MKPLKLKDFFICPSCKMPLGKRKPGRPPNCPKCRLDTVRDLA